MTQHVSPSGEIRKLAEIVLQEGLSDRFRQKAAIASASFGAVDLEDLEHYLHHSPRESTLYIPSEHGYGGWISACQFSVFEIVFNLGRPALPWLRRFAWGEYDWTQGNAIELLIRHAAAGIETEEIVAEISRKFPSIRYEAQLYAIEPLIPLIENDESLRAVIERLAKSSAFAKAYTDVTQ